MKSLFDFSDYRLFFASKVKETPNGSRGQVNRISEFLGVHPTLTSQVLRGRRDFSPEQGLKLCQYYGLNELETETILTLLHCNRAGDSQLKNYYREKLKKLRGKSEQVKNRLRDHHRLTEAERTEFYSSWLYTGIRLYTSLAGGKSLDEIVSQFQLDRPTTTKILLFLIETGLCAKANEKYSMATQHTHLEFGSPHLHKHHTNWRLKALQRMDRLTERELMFTAPFTASAHDIRHLRETLLKLISEATRSIADSPSEQMACLNIDLFHW